MSLIELDKVSKFYRNKNNISSGFNKISLKLDMGEFVTITGESGSGKSTLLNVISGLDSYEEGEMYINGEETSHYTEVDYELYRRKYIGNIFQHFNLISSYTVYQNVELVLLLSGSTKKEAKKRVNEILQIVGLTKYKNSKASHLSGGQKQRVAIARALAKDTPIIVADEPTGNLDVKSAKEILKLLSEIAKNKLVVIVTHNYEQVESYTTRKITMHDGKIIEDKVIKSHEEVEIKPANYSGITKINQLILGLRNTINVKVKFILLLLVYFFITLVMFSEYTSLKKIDFDEADFGYNYNFNDQSPERVILNKKDKTNFSKDEIKKLENIDNIGIVVENDILLDQTYSLYTEDYEMYFDGPLYSVKGLDKVDIGRKPQTKNEIVLEISSNNFIYEFYNEKILEGTYILNDNYTGETKERYSIVGIKLLNDDSYNAKYYILDELLDSLRKEVNIRYTKNSITVNNKTYSEEDNYLYYQIMPNKNVSTGNVYIFEELDYMSETSMLYKNLKIDVKNIYYKESLNLKITRIVNKDNFKYLTGLKNYDDYRNVIFINPNDYDTLYNKDSYQVSVFLKDTKRADVTLNTLKDMGYNTLYMRDTLVDEFGNISGFLKIFRTVTYIISTVVLFFISYFIIKLILKSRNIYYSTVRILGATKKISTSLLNIELLFDIIIAYILFLFLVLLVKVNIISVDYIQDMVFYLKVSDYIIVFMILISMSLLISNRYASKLFKDSAMNAYREEV